MSRTTNNLGAPLSTCAPQRSRNSRAARSWQRHRGAAVFRAAPALAAAGVPGRERSAFRPSFSRPRGRRHWNFDGGAPRASHRVDHREFDSGFIGEPRALTAHGRASRASMQARPARLSSGWGSPQQIGDKGTHDRQSASIDPSTAPAVAGPPDITRVGSRCLRYAGVQPGVTSEMARKIASEQRALHRVAARAGLCRRGRPSPPAPFSTPSSRRIHLAALLVAHRRCLTSRPHSVSSNDDSE
jgi:hypothetical protein